MFSRKILKNGTIISFDDSTESLVILPRASLLIEDGFIGAIAKDIPAPADAEIIGVEGKIVSPGFVNTHVHMWQTAYRSIAADVSLTHYFDWLSQSGETAQKAFSPKDVYTSTLEGYLEGLNAGVTSYVDHAHADWSQEVAEAAYDGAVACGARVWWCYNIRSGNKTFSRAEQWQMYQELAAKPRPPTLALGLSYDSLAGSDTEETASIRSKVEDLKIEALTIHHLGGPWGGLPSSPTDLVEQGLADFQIPVIISHARYLSAGDMSLLRQHNMHVSITPKSEFHYSHDTNFTFSGDMLTQARLWLQTVRDRKYQQFFNDTNLVPRNTPMSVQQAFLLATRQGSKALWRNDIGVLKVGAKADIVVFNGDSPNMLGWSDPIAAVLLHANMGDVEHVLVNGEWRKKDFKLVNMKHDWEDVKARLLKCAKKVQAQALPPPPVTDRLWGFKDTGDLEVVSTLGKC